MNINTLDLNLLKVFDALYKTRNVSHAGERMGIAQSSMSNALKRLRDQFNDPLFQRTPKGMIPTARAEQLAPHVQRILSELENLLEPTAFDPALVQGRITIAASDLAVTTLGSALVARLEVMAPYIQTNFLPLDKTEVFEKIDAGALDFALGTFAKVPAHMRRKTLSEDHFICIARAGHAQLSDELTLENYCRLKHVLMTLNADQTGVIDTALKKYGRRRYIAMTCAQFAPIVDIVAKSDLIATVPKSLSGHAIRAGCRCYPLPFAMAAWQSEVVCSQRFYSDPLGKFIVDLIGEVGHSGDMSS